MDNKEVQKTEYTVVKPYEDTIRLEHAAKCGGDRNLVEFVIATDDNYQFYYLVKRPSKTVIQAIAEIKEKPESKKSEKDITSIQKLMIGCILEGDKEAFEHDGAIYTELLKKISGLVNKSKENLKKS